jgi:hypothetical protein
MPPYIVRAACALTGVAWYCLPPNPSWGTTGNADAPSMVRTQASAERAVFEIVVKEGRLVSGRRVLVVHRNDEVTMRITSDKADEFHLHGYNKIVELAPDHPATLTFKATLTGRFTSELHGTDLVLGARVVYP